MSLYDETEYTMYEEQLLDTIAFLNDRIESMGNDIEEYRLLISHYRAEHSTENSNEKV